MKETTTKPKKETILSVLQDIRLLLQFHEKGISEMIEKEDPAGFTVSDKGLVVTFPKKTAKQLIDECNNTVSGGKVLYNTDWYKGEDFFIKETCRPRTITLSDKIEHGGKSWDECKELVGEENMFNFAEIVYLLIHNEDFRESLVSSNDSGIWWTWTNSRDSSGGFVSVGAFGAAGADVNAWYPGFSDSDVGVRFSRSE